MGLKEKTVNSVLWSLVERFSVMGINFVLSIIIARLVTPTDFGAIAMLTIFLGISNVFIDSGFANALIRKTDRTDIDNSTVFYFNIVVGLCIYFLLFFASPFIASFYKMPILKPVLRIIALVIFFNSLSIVQQAILTAKLDFKSQAKISLLSVSISGLIGVIMAYYNFGVWALATQMTIAALLRMILLWVYVRWQPIKAFSKESFNSLFSYGSKLLGANLIVTLNGSISSLILGKKFNAEQLGYYNRGEQFVNFPLNSISAIFQKVTFPVFSLRKDNLLLLREYYLKTIRVTCMLIAPAMAIMFILAKDIVLIFLTEKWLASVELMRILIFALAWTPIFSININILSVLGYSKHVLNIELSKTILRILSIIIALPYGIKAICIALAISTLINTFFYTYFTYKVIRVGWIIQMSQCYIYIISSIIIGVFVNYILLNFNNSWLRIIFGIFIFSLLYLMILYLFDRNNLKYITSLIPSIHNRN